MKRRKFLKLLSWSPFMFLVPGAFVRKKPILKKRIRSYLGNGKESQVITGVGFQPKYVGIYGPDAEFIAYRDLERKRIIEAFKIPKLYLGKGR